eukprot:TRINITY_DN9149_c0_g1_i10.p1 TRINITY_DN9149_c0_g1~~TRINITY_DN9149_c0_g1_i10.p1  ORF type:complete len:243 (-),score=68.35 TRINITY_DN9149_c0_g1_i10:259-987(-)
MSTELLADLGEVEHLLTLATRPQIRKFLQAEIDRLMAAQASAENAANESAPAESAPAESAPAKPVLVARAPTAATANSTHYIPIDKFAWDQGEYNTPWLTIYLTSGMDGVGAVKQDVNCDFGPRSFDLKIHGLGGKNYRMIKNKLDEEINVEKSKVVVKKNSVSIKLHKTKGDETYASYKTWMNLESKKTKEEEQRTKEDPTAGIMDLMKDMYDNGDEQMKKTIGEAMMKSKNRDPMEGMDE